MSCFLTVHLFVFFFFNDTATTEIYTVPYTLSLHDALPISCRRRRRRPWHACAPSGMRSEEHTSELQSHGTISYAVFCLKKKKKKHTKNSSTLNRMRKKNNENNKIL